MGYLVKKNKLVAVCGWRWEPEWLVNEFVKNIAPIVDDYHIIDNRNQTGAWQNEGEYRVQQRTIARRMNGAWFLLTSPDERFEDRAAGVIRKAVNHGPRAPRALRMCEMWNMTQFRVDGQFKYRPRFRLFPVADMFGNVKHKRIHSSIINTSARRRRRKFPHLDARIYHLKNSTPENRAHRVEMMKQLDKEIGQSRDASWDDFLDPDVELQDIEPGRGFSPPYTRPFVWNADVGEVAK